MIPSNYKPKRGLGQAVTRQRRKAIDQLKREQDKRLSEHRDAIRRSINEAVNRESNRDYFDYKRFMSNILNSTMESQTAVMRSYGLKQSVTTTLQTGWMNDGTVTAYTDFDQIVIRWPSKFDPENLWSVMDTDRIADTVAQMKGVFQHELGHLRFTTPFPILKEKAIEVWEEALDEDSKNNSNSGWAQRAHRAWNAIEDQRMECAVVRDVPRIGSYFTRMIVEHLLKTDHQKNLSWLLLAGRDYLPKELRAESRRQYTQYVGDDGTKAEVWLYIVNGYKKATTPDRLLFWVIEASRFLLDQEIPDDTSKHDTHPDRGATDRETNEAENKASSGATEAGEDDTKDDDGDADGAGAKAEGDEGESAGDDAGAGADGAGDESDDAQTDSGQGHGVGNGAGEEPQEGQDNFQKALEQALKQAKSEVHNDSEVQEITKNTVASVTKGGLTDITFVGSDMPADMVASAHRTAIGIENALSDFVTTSQPVWRNQQEEGAIDALSYRTKQVGDRDFFRNLDGLANEGLDVHVSMLCDVSVSMGGAPILALSEAVYATALACQNLGIGASFTLWSSDGQNHRIWSDGAPEPQVWPTLGGTDPTEALNDLDNHNDEGATQHLVIVFTDGEWNDGFDLQQWARPNRHIVLVRYASDYNPTDAYGADEVAEIKQVEQLPDELTRALRGVLNK